MYLTLRSVSINDGIHIIWEFLFGEVLICTISKHAFLPWY
jgi:hypothetical protein